jgi:hypothetical protein
MLSLFGIWSILMKYTEKAPGLVFIEYKLQNYVMVISWNGSNCDIGTDVFVTRSYAILAFFNCMNNLLAR